MSHLDDIREKALPKSGSAAIVQDGDPAQTQGWQTPLRSRSGAWGKVTEDGPHGVAQRGSECTRHPAYTPVSSFYPLSGKHITFYLVPQRFRLP